MADLIIPDSRFEQPEFFYPNRKPTSNVKINWNHPMTRDLLVYPVIKSDSTVINIVNNRPFTINDGVTKKIINGESINVGSVDDDGLEIFTDLVTSKGFTMATHFKLDALNSTGQGLMCISSKGLGVNNWARLTAQTNISGDPYRFQLGAANEVLIDQETADTNQNFAAVSGDGATKGALYVNKSEYLQTGIDYSSLVLDNLFLGSWYQDSSGNYLQPTEGALITAVLWNRQLSRSEIDSFRLKPYQFLEPA